MGWSKISVGFDADTTGLVDGARRAGRAMDALGADVKALKSTMGVLVGINAAQLFGQITAGVSYAISSFRDMAGAASESVDQLSKFAQRTGMMYADMAGFALAADLAGVSAESLVGAMTRADRAFVEAQRGSKSAADAFARIGLTIEGLSGLDAAGRFAAIAAAIGSLPTEAEQAAAAIALFGRSGAELLPLFQQGAAGIAEAREQADRLGLALTNEQGKAVEAMNDSWTLVSKSIEGIVQQVVANLAPAIQGLNEMWTDFVQATGGQNIGEYISDALFEAGLFLADIADYLYQNLSSVWEYAYKVGQQWSGVWDVGVRFAGVMQAVTGAWNAVFGLFLLGITGTLEVVVSSLRDLVSYIPGVDTTYLDGQIEQLNAFNQSLVDGVTANTEKARQGYEQMLNGVGREAGEAIAGPVRATLERARDVMKANRVEVAVEAAAPLKVDAGPIAAAMDKFASAVDIQSSEGTKELLRLMYGGSSKIEEQQLRAQERMAEGIDRVNDNLEGGLVEALDI